MEAADNVFEARGFAPGDAVPLLRRAGVVVVDTLKIVVLVVPACNALTRPRRPLRETSGLSDGRVDGDVGSRRDHRHDRVTFKVISAPRRGPREGRKQHTHVEPGLRHAR